MGGSRPLRPSVRQIEDSVHLKKELKRYKRTLYAYELAFAKQKRNAPPSAHVCSGTRTAARGVGGISGTDCHERLSSLQHTAAACGGQRGSGRERDAQECASIPTIVWPKIRSAVLSTVCILVLSCFHCVKNQKVSLVCGLCHRPNSIQPSGNRRSPDYPGPVHLWCLLLL